MNKVEAMNQNLAARLPREFDNVPRFDGPIRKVVSHRAPKIFRKAEINQVRTTD